MATEISGVQTGRETADAQKAAKRRGRLQLLGVGLCTLGVYAGMHWRRSPQPALIAEITERAITGTWELQSVNGDPVGPKVVSSVVSQRLTLGDGKLHGETRLRADSAAANSAMPFPDASASGVKTSADGREVVVTWDGSYTLLDNNRLSLHVGKAMYRVGLTWNPRAQTLDFDPDAILTFKGAARYHALTGR